MSSICLSTNIDQESHIMLKIKQERHLWRFFDGPYRKTFIWFALLIGDSEHWFQKDARIFWKHIGFWWCPLLTSSYWNLMTRIPFLKWENKTRIRSHIFLIFLFTVKDNFICYIYIYIYIYVYIYKDRYSYHVIKEIQKWQRLLFISFFAYYNRNK